MGKPRRKTGRSGKGKEDILRRLNLEVDGLAIGDGKRSKKKHRDKPPATVDECLEKAKNALDAYNIDDAFRLCNSALQLEPVRSHGLARTLSIWLVLFKTDRRVN